MEMTKIQIQYSPIFSKLSHKKLQYLKWYIFLICYQKVCCGYLAESLTGNKINNSEMTTEMCPKSSFTKASRLESSKVIHRKAEALMVIFE